MGIVVDDENEPAPEKVLNYKDIMPAPETLNFGFQGFYPWRQSWNFPVLKVRTKILSNIWDSSFVLSGTELVLLIMIPKN